MTKLTGKGRPTMNTPGEVGQYYEDLNTGDIYECRRSSKYSPTHHAPVGGYWWELRAKGEDITDHGDFYGGSGSAGNLVISVKELDNSNSTINSANMTYAEIKAAIEAGTLESVIVKFMIWAEAGLAFKTSDLSIFVTEFGDGDPAIGLSFTMNYQYDDWGSADCEVYIFEDNRVYAYEHD